MLTNWLVNRRRPERRTEWRRAPNLTSPQRPGATQRLALEQLEDRCLLAAFPLPLNPVAPLGALVYEGTAAESIDSASEVKSFTIEIEDGQTISLVVDPDASLIPDVLLKDPFDSIVDGAVAASAGQNAVVQSFPTVDPGTYTIEVTGDDATTGSFSVELTLNAAIELESNGTPGTAQNIEATFFTLGGARTAFVGAAGGGEDWFEFELGDGEIANVVVELISGTDVELELYAGDGITLLAKGKPAENAELVISQFQDATSDAGPDTYFVRLAAATSINYNLVVTKGLDFDSELNELITDAQDITLTADVLGHASDSDSDFYRFAVASGDELAITTVTPADGTQQPINLIDPQIELFDPTGAPISHTNVVGNETLNHTAALDGFYAVRVFADSGNGEYRLAVSGHTGARPDFVANAVDPIDGAILATTPTQMTFSLSDDLLASSVAATDLLVDGNPATAVEIVDGQTLVFDLPVLGEGLHSVSLAADTLEDLDGQLLQEFTSQFTVDLTAPRVVDASVTDGDIVLIGDLTLTATFDEALDESQLDTNDVTLVGVTNGAQVPTSVTFDDQTLILTAEFTGLPQDDYTWTLLSGDGLLEDLAGNNLDGEPNPAFPSGDSSPDGNFFVTFDALPPFEVVAIDPADGSLLTSGPTQITILLSDDSLVGSVDPGDLTINGSPATGVNTDDIEELIFTFPELTDGEYAVNLAAGVLEDLDGQLLQEFSSQFTVDLTAPRVVDASVTDGDIVLIGDLTLTATFDEALDESQLGVEDVTLVGLTNGAQTPTSVSFDDQTLVLTAEFTGLPQDNYTWTLRSGDGLLEDLAGNDLDGEPNPTFPSGNASPGGDFLVTFDALPPFEVVSIDPADGALLATGPTEVTIDFSDDVLVTSLEPGDLTINGNAATGVNEVDGDTFTFTFPALSDGEYTVNLAADSLEDDGDGQLLQEFSSQFTVDLTAPRVIGASVADGDTLSFGDVTVITATFDEALDESQLDTGDVTLVGQVSGPQTPTSVTFDDQTLMLTVEFSGLPEDDFTWTLLSGDGLLEDLAGNDLDGEPNPDFPSGNAAAGGEFVMTFDVDRVDPAPLVFDRLEPLGSLIFASLGMPGLSNFASDIDRFSFFAQAGETLTARLTPVEPLASMSLELEGIVAPIVSATPGAAVLLPITSNVTSGEITLRVKGDRTTEYSLDVWLNTSLETFVGDAGNENELDLDNTLIDVGSGRWAVLGTAVPDEGVAVGNLELEPNDDLTTAVFSGIGIGTGVNEFVASASIGDNDEFTSAPGLDVDLIQIELNLGDRVIVDIDAEAIGSTLDPVLTLFDADGQTVVQNDDSGSLDSLIDFTATLRGTYFVGISGFANVAYDPTTSGSGIEGSIGVYDLNISVNGGGDLPEPSGEVTVPDVDEYTFNLADAPGKTLDVILTGQGGVDLTGQLVELLDIDGVTVLASAVSDPLGTPAENYDLAIVDFAPAQAGVYTVRVSSAVPGDYSLTIGYGLRMTTEPNDLPGDALRELPFNSSSIGFLSGAAEPTGPGPPPSGSGGSSGSLVESEPNDTTANANFVALGFETGQEERFDVTGEITTGDVDIFQFSLQPGDILSANLLGPGMQISLRDVNDDELVGSAQNLTTIYPDESELPTHGNAALAWVIDTASDYTISVLGSEGTYELDLRVFRPALERQLLGNHQTLYLDFDGETIDTSVFGRTGFSTLSPLVNYLEGWGLTAGDESTVIDGIVAVMEENLSTDIRERGSNGDFDASGNVGEFDIEILNSRDHADPFGQPNVTRIIVGGSIEEFGFFVLGRAESIDIGNFATEETAVVLLDTLSSQSSPSSLNSFTLDPLASIIDLVAIGVGNIAAHEAAHLFGALHTNQFNVPATITDQGGNLGNIVGLVGSVWGDGDEVDVDFGPDQYVANEGFTGTEHTLELIAFGLSTGIIDPAELGPSVIAVDPASGINTSQNIDTLTVEFSEPITVASATDSANYQLIEAGPNGIFDDGAFDDVVIPLTPAFDGNTIVTLTVDSGSAPLGFGQYQLTVEGDSSIEDLDGNPLGSTTGPGNGQDAKHEFDVLFVEAGGDLYEVNIPGLQTLTIATLTPFDDASGQPLNDLDPQLVIYDSDGLAVAVDNGSRDGKNAQITFRAPVSDTYTIQVLAQAGSGEYELQVISPLLPGDYNRDGLVNLIDYTVWRDTRGINVLPLTGADGDGDGIVGNDDFDIWKSNFGSSAPSAGALIASQTIGAPQSEGGSPASDVPGPVVASSAKSVSSAQHLASRPLYAIERVSVGRPEPTGATQVSRARSEIFARLGPITGLSGQRNFRPTLRGEFTVAAGSTTDEQANEVALELVLTDFPAGPVGTSGIGTTLGDSITLDGSDSDSGTDGDPRDTVASAEIAWSDWETS